MSVVKPLREWIVLALLGTAAVLAWRWLNHRDAEFRAIAAELRAAIAEQQAQIPRVDTQYLVQKTRYERTRDSVTYIVGAWPSDSIPRVVAESAIVAVDSACRRTYAACEDRVRVRDSLLTLLRAQNDSLIAQRRPSHSWKRDGFLLGAGGLLGLLLGQ